LSATPGTPEVGVLGGRRELVAAFCGGARCRCRQQQRGRLRRRWRRGNWRRRRRRRLADEIEVAEQRERHLGQLPLIGRLVDVGRDMPEQRTDLDTGLADLPDERGRERTVTPLAVGGHRAGLRGIRDHGARGLLDPCQAARDRHGARRIGLRQQLVRKRIVATGVEHQDAHAAGALQVGEDVVDPRHLRADIGGAGQSGIDGDEIIRAPELKAVTAVKEQRGIGSDGGVGKAAERIVHAALVEIDTLHHLEAGALQHPRHIGRVIARIGQLHRVAIGRVADHQRHAPLGKGRARCGHAAEEDKRRTRDPAPD